MAKKCKGPCLPDWQTILAMAPKYLDGGYPIPTAAYEFLKEIDLAQATKRYKWYNLPEGVTDELIERILYYRGQGCFFYQKEMGKFFFLPYSLDGEIGVYGEYLNVVPLPWTGANQAKDPNGKLKEFIPGLRKTVIYEEVDIESSNLNLLTDGCVLLHDRGIGISQITQPRERLNDWITQIMAECPALARTSLIANCGVSGMRVNNEDEESNVEAASQARYSNAMTGQTWLAIQGQQDFQDFNTSGVTEADTYFRTFESLDNLRLAGYGLNNQGVFDKAKEYVNNVQAMGAQQNVGFVYNDGLYQRQNFCNIANSIWGTAMWCDSSENATNADMNGDGLLQDSQEPSMPQEQEQGGEENDV